MWRPSMTSGDKYTIHSTDSSQMASTRNNLARPVAKGESQPLIYTPRTKTAIAYAQGAKPRRSKTSDLSKKSFTKHLVVRSASAGIIDYSENNKNHPVITDHDFDELFPEVPDDKSEDGTSTKENRPFSVLNQRRTPSAHSRGSRAPSALSRGSRAPSARSKTPLTPRKPENEESVHFEADSLKVIHRIRGLTPREDSERSTTMTNTPETTDRLNRGLPPPCPVPASSRSTSPVTETFNTTPIQDNDLSQSQTFAKLEETNEDLKTETGKRVDTLPEPDLSSLVDVEGKTAALSDIPEGSDVHSNEKTNTSVEEENRHHLKYEETGQEGGKQAGDNCPVCLADASQSTFITTVSNQEEGLNTSGPVTGVLTPERLDTGFTNESTTPRVGNFGEIPDSANALRYSGAARLRVSGQHPSLRPHSAADDSRYYVITHPPAVIPKQKAAPGAWEIRTPGPRPHSDMGGHFKTHFQQQREEAWKSTTKFGRPRPVTAIVRTSNSSSFRPPPRPVSPCASGVRNPRLKVTRTDKWLGGGRDLYWEDMRKRPKSGHTPGWKEGLPESMAKKQRPKSAIITLLRPSSGEPHRPQTANSALTVKSCFRCERNPDTRRRVLAYSQADEPEEEEMNYVLSLDPKLFEHEQLLQIPQHSHQANADDTPVPLGSPVSEESDFPLPFIHTEAGLR